MRLGDCVFLLQLLWHCCRGHCPAARMWHSRDFWRFRIWLRERIIGSCWQSRVHARVSKRFYSCFSKLLIYDSLVDSFIYMAWVANFFCPRCCSGRDTAAGQSRLELSLFLDTAALVQVRRTPLVEEVYRAHMYLRGSHRHLHQRIMPERMIFPSAIAGDCRKIV